MFITQAFNSLHDWWRYAVGIVVVFIATQIGSLPFITIAGFKMMQEGKGFQELDDMSKLMTVLDANLTLFLMLLSFAVGLAALLLIIRFLHKQPLLEATTARKKIDWGRFWFGFGLIALITITLTGIDYYMSPDDYVVQFEVAPFLILTLIVIVFIPLQTSMEEYLFRGYLMQGIGVATIKNKFPFVIFYLILSAIIYFVATYLFLLVFIYKLLIIVVLVAGLFILLNSKFIDNFTQTKSYQVLFLVFSRNFTPLFFTSVIFGVLHLANPEVDKLGNTIMVYYIGTGFLLGIMTLMDDGLELALGFHAGNNMIAALLVTADWTVFQTDSILKDISEPSAGFDVLIPVLVFYPIILYIMARRYGWSNWKEKLFGKVEIPINTDTEILQNKNPH